jgi:hypothetical protein
MLSAWLEWCLEFAVVAAVLGLVVLVAALVVLW